MKPPIYVPQGYPMFIAWCHAWGRQDNPSTDEGRESIREHAGRSDQDIQNAIEIDPIIMWLIPADEFTTYPIPVTTGGTVERDVMGGMNYVINIDPDVARSDLIQELQDARQQARRRCAALGLTPYGRC